MNLHYFKKGVKNTDSSQKQLGKNDSRRKVEVSSIKRFKTSKPRYTPDCSQINDSKKENPFFIDTQEVNLTSNITFEELSTIEEYIPLLSQAANTAKTNNIQKSKVLQSLQQHISKADICIKDLDSKINHQKSMLKNFYYQQCKSVVDMNIRKAAYDVKRDITNFLASRSDKPAIFDHYHNKTLNHFALDYPIWSVFYRKMLLKRAVKTISSEINRLNDEIDKLRLNL